MARFDPLRPDFEPYGLTCVRWTPTVMPRPDRHNEVELNLLKRGSLTYLLGGRKVTIQAGRLAVFWAAIPHQIIGASGHGDYFVATLPLAWFLDWRLPDRLVQPILHAQVVSDPATATTRDDLGHFEQWVGDLQRPREDKRRAVLLELEARLLRLAMSLPPYEPPTPARKGTLKPVERAGLSKAEQMACLIAQHYTEPLRVEDISESAGLHPNYAMSLFKRVFATTINDYLTQHRISHAQRLLATTEQKVLAIALDSGFGSVSRFNAAFKDACGCSPRQYRAEHRL